MAIFANCRARPCLGHVLAATRAGANGDFYLTMILPPAPGGSYDVAGEDPTGGAFAVTMFDVVPKASPSPAYGSPGAVITLSGEGFGANEIVVVRGACGSGPCPGDPLAKAETDATGSFSTMVTVPEVSPGTYALMVAGTASGLVTDSAFTVTG